MNSVFSTFEVSSRAVRKRRAEDTNRPTDDEFVSSVPISSSHSLVQLATIPTLMVKGSSPTSTLSSRAPTSFSSPSPDFCASRAPPLLPSSHSTPSLCPASVPADLHIQQYYHIEEERTPCTQPPIPCTYIPFDDDQERFSLKMPEDPFMLDFGNDYVTSARKECQGSKTAY